MLYGRFDEVFHRAVLAMPLEYDAFLKYSAKRWPGEGWILSPTGEMEPGESENNFIRGETFGAFRARRAYCEGGWSEILLTVGRSPTNRPGTTTTSVITPTTAKVAS